MAFCWPIATKWSRTTIKFGKYANLLKNRFSKIKNINNFTYIFSSATDCLNGTKISENILPTPFMNFTQFWKIYNDSSNVIDPTDKYDWAKEIVECLPKWHSFVNYNWRRNSITFRFLPKQTSLTIYNTSQLYINLEGCVNTLRGECMEFLHSHGRDGDNNTAQSRYLCYYNKVSKPESFRWALRKLFKISISFVLSCRMMRPKWWPALTWIKRGASLCLHSAYRPHCSSSRSFRCA